MKRQAPQLVEHFFRHEYGRTVAVLVRRYGASRIELIEDCVQNAMALALTSWSQRGLPDNPAAWLMRAANNALIDKLRRQGVGKRVLASQAEGPTAGLEPEAYLPAEVEDEQLRMLFVCCDEALEPRTQLVLALKILCGFSVAEIALRLFSRDDAIRKRLQRGRTRLKALSPSLQSPALASLQVRLPAVQRVIYLLFNEGYSSSKPEQHIRRELCAEALRLGELLTRHAVGDEASSWALRALMHMHHARIEARCDETGAMVLLEEQDRNRWDKDEIQLGLQMLVRSSSQAEVSRYHIEAAILMEHCTARSYEDTNWKDIARLYEALERRHPSPLYTINRAIALAQLPPGQDAGPAAGLALLRSTTPPAWLARYYLWDASMGELLRRVGQFEAAIAHLTKAEQGAPTEAEKHRLRARIAQCEAAETS